MKIFPPVLCVALMLVATACQKNNNGPGNNVIASFSISGYEAAAPADITFINFSNSATSYFWNFGDGSTSTLFNPHHTYNAAGTYLVQLTATGPSGSQTICKLVSIANSPANTSAFSYFFDKCTGTPVGASFKTVNPLSTNIVWDFGNGNINIGRDPIIQFVLPGDYTLKYSSEINGVRDTVTTIIRIQ